MSGPARLEAQAPSHFGRWGHPLGYTSYVLSSALITTARHSLLLGEVPVENTSFFFFPPPQQMALRKILGLWAELALSKFLDNQDPNSRGIA